MQDIVAFFTLFYHPLYLFLWGACWGSFLNVVLFRYPLGRSVVSPGSACPACARPIAFYDNIPVLSWFLLRGRCRHCKAPFSIRYALNEALFGTLSAAAVVLHPHAPLAGLSLGTGLLAGLPGAYLLLRHHKLPWYLAVTFLGCAGLYVAELVRG